MSYEYKPLDESPEDRKEAEEIQKNVETFNDQVKPMERLMHAVRVLLFLCYAVTAIILFNFSVGKSACFIQSTYKQEFVVNIVSNPFFSSNSIVRNPPLSKIEIYGYNATNFTQRASDIVVFPNTIKNVYENSAFWPVALKPHPVMVAGEVIPSTRYVVHLISNASLMLLPSLTPNDPWGRMDPGKYYFDPATKQVIPSGIPFQGGAGVAFQNMILSYVKGRFREGMQLPNFVRCNRGHLPDPEKLYGTSAEDQVRTSTRMHRTSQTCNS